MQNIMYGNIGVLGRAGAWVTKHRIVLSILLFTGLILEDLNEGSIPRDLHGFNDRLGRIGIALILSGVALRSWAAGCIRKTKKLATTGPYSLVRHPLYLGSCLIALGFGSVIFEGENLVAVLALALIVYLPKIKQEERHLNGLFGDEWETYSQWTGLLFPKKRPVIHCRWSIQQWISNQEYKALATSIGTIGALECWRIFTR